jgi:RND family efflux transporter MFP subunit
MKALLSLPACIVACLALGGCVDRDAQKQAKETAAFLSEKSKTVSTVEASYKRLEQTLDISGEITAGEDSSLAFLQPGRVAAVFVNEGDHVTVGQLLTRQETTTARDQLRQARATLTQALASEEQARAALDQAERNATVGPQKSSSTVRQAQAQLRSARAAYNKAMAGARPEERKQAEANVEAAEVALDTAQKELKRTERLVAAGAIPGKELDTQRSAVAAASATLETAVQNREVLKNGNRQEDIDQALEQVRQAEEAVRVAEADQRLDPLLQSAVRSAKAQLRNARAQEEEALASVSLAEQMLRDTEIRSPFAGKVSGKPLQAGTTAGPSAPVVRVIGDGGLYFNGQLPGSKVALLRVGMLVSATVEGRRNTSFSGRIAAISPMAQGAGRLFSVRVQLAETPGSVKPGMFVKGRIAINASQGTVVPKQAVMTEGTRCYLFAVRGGNATLVHVTPGLIQGEQQLVRGVSPGEQIVVQGQHALENGDRVTLDNTAQEKEQK